MPLRIIGAAYPRTGTISLKLALERLGFGPCYHMSELIHTPQYGGLWIAAAEGRPDWDAIFRDYRSCADAPACYFWRELAQHYPKAGVILVERDPETWFESLQATVLSPAWIETTLRMPLAPVFAKLYARYGDKIHDRGFMIADYLNYCTDVKRTVPEERLLVFKTGEGWERLCRFLGVPVPDSPFPKSNTRDEMQAVMAQLRRGLGEIQDPP